MVRKWYKRGQIGGVSHCLDGQRSNGYDVGVTLDRQASKSRLYLAERCSIFLSKSCTLHRKSTGASVAADDAGGCDLPRGGWLCSDDPGVADLGHHARHHVVEIVAVKRPAAGIVGVQGDGDAVHWRHQDGISHCTCERGSAYRDPLESVAMKMYRVRHLRVVQQLDCHALARGDHQRGYVRLVFAVQRPSIRRHGAGEDHAVLHIGRARRQRGDRFETTFKREIDRQRIFYGLRGEA
jgi:hypothetical protein